MPLMISVAIPTYEMNGKGVELLRRSFDILTRQTYKDFEVVVSDNSKNDDIKNLCAEYGSKLKINYFKNPRIGMAPNTNEAIKASKGDLIKILYQDDFLADDNSLQDIHDNFKGQWLATACEHLADTGERFNLHIPSYNDKIHVGSNSIGSPSVITIKNDNPLLFDEKMTWRLDGDYYKRMHDKYGNPTILSKPNIVIGVGKHQTTFHLSDEYKESERDYMYEKYNEEKPKVSLLRKVKTWLKKI